MKKMGQKLFSTILLLMLTLAFVSCQEKALQEESISESRATLR